MVWKDLRKMNSCNFVLGIDVDFLQDKDKFDYWYSQMLGERKAKIDKFRPLNSKLLSLGAGIVLKRGLDMLGFTDSVILEDQNEKPYLQGATGLEFNLSHSGKIAVCAFSDAPVGIDVQEPERFSGNLMNFGVEFYSNDGYLHMDAVNMYNMILLTSSGIYFLHTIQMRFFWNFIYTQVPMPVLHA